MGAFSQHLVCKPIALLFLIIDRILKAVVFWVMSWKIWETIKEAINIRYVDWNRQFLTSVEKAIRMLEDFYYKMVHHQWMPIFIQNRLDMLKIQVRLRKLADSVQSRNEMLAKPTTQEAIKTELNSIPEVVKNESNGIDIVKEADQLALIEQNRKDKSTSQEPIVKNEPNGKISDINSSKETDKLTDSGKKSKKSKK